MKSDPFDQSGFRCRLVWGRRGARDAVDAGGITVVVDVLSFSTAVATATAHGGCIIPCADAEEAAAVAAERGVIPALGRRDVSGPGSFSLSPVTFLGMEPGATVALGSPNGAVCSRAAAGGGRLYVASLVNASAVARAVSAEMDRSGVPVTVIACGERWWTPFQDEGMRVAIEDYLGAGAVLAGLDGELSPEALVCRGAFVQLQGDLPRIIADCGSGRELREKGFLQDVVHASRLDLYDTAPVLKAGRLLDPLTFSGTLQSDHSV